LFIHIGKDPSQARSQNCEKRILANSRLSVCLSVRMEQLCSHWMDFHEIWVLSIFRKSVEKILVSLKSNKNKRVHYIKTYVHLWPR